MRNQPPAWTPDDAAALLDRARDPGSDAPWPLPSAEQLAQRIPGVAVHGLLAAGGMGAVYRGRQTTLDRPVAIKLIPADLWTQPAIRRRFASESRILAHLHHPGVVRVYDSGEDADGAWLILELVEGVNLRQAMSVGRLPVADVVDLLRQACAAVAHVHQQGIIHRDLKPENLLLDESGRLRVTDFGIARGEGAASSTATALVGTWAYVPPEVVQGSPPTIAGDVYSLGVVLYELLTGTLPLGRLAAPSQIAGSDPRLDGIVMRCLDRLPDRRFADAGALDQALREWQDQVLNRVGAKPVIAGVCRRLADHRRQPVWWWRLGFLLLLSAGTLGLWLYLGFVMARPWRIGSQPAT